MPVGATKAAQLLGVSTSMLRKLRETPGVLPAKRNGYGYFEYAIEDLEKVGHWRRVRNEQIRLARIPPHLQRSEHNEL